MKRLIGKLFIISGVLLIAGVIYINFNTARNNQNTVNEYKQNIENVSNKKYQTDVVGILDIPKIDLEVAVKKGTDQESLKYAVGQFENSVMPGEKGNFSIAGHSSYTSNKFFSNLNKVEIGDEINVLSLDKTYKYIVDSIEVVTPDKVEVVDSDKSGKKEITLVTCTPKYVGSHRLIVKGTCVN